MPSPASLRLPVPSSRAPTAPPAPCPWLWRCHQCHIWYRLSTTRRCLECSHEFCLGAAPTARKRKRSAAAPCRAEFDYIGWAARGAWKRTMLLNTRNNKSTAKSSLNHTHTAPHPLVLLRRPLAPTTPTTETDDEGEEGGVLLPRRQRWLSAAALTTAWGDEHRALEHGIDVLTDRFAEKKEALFVRRRHNCWLHCDFPSECHHVVYKAQQEGRPVLARARALDEAWLAKERALRVLSSTAATVVKKGVVVREAAATSKSFIDDDDLSESSDSDSDLDSDVPSPLASSSTQHERLQVIDGLDPAAPPISPISPTDLPQRTSSLITANLDGSDFSYESFKRAAGIVSNTSTDLMFEIHVDDSSNNNNTGNDTAASGSPPASPLVSTATALPIAIPGVADESAVKDVEEDLDVFLTGLYTAAAKDRRFNAKRASTATATSPASADAAASLLSLQSFVPFDAFQGTPPVVTAAAEHATAGMEASAVSRKTLQQLEQAYSQQAWFLQPQTPDTTSSRRASRSEHMLTVLSRRTSLPPPPPPAVSSIFDDWEDSDAETATSTSTLTNASPPCSPPSSADEAGEADGDGDICMLLDEDDDDEKSITPTGPAAQDMEICVGLEEHSILSASNDSDDVYR